jgi:cell division protein FtsW (lipid II flippase)
LRRFVSFRDFDWILLALVLGLSVISIFEIYSATLHTKFVGFENKQVFWLLGGLAAMFVLSVVNYHRLLEAVHWIYGFCLVSLVAVLLVGTKVMGGKRWIKLPGGIHFQPSEWVKLVLIVAMARYFSSLAGKELTWGDIFKSFLMVGVPMLLVLKQPDLGTSLTYLPVLIIGLFLGGLEWKKAMLLVVAGLVLVVPVWATIADRCRRRRYMGQGCHERYPNAGGFSAYPIHRLHLCGVLRGARLRRCGLCSPAILFDIGAFDPKCSDSRGCFRYVPDHGRCRCAHLSDCG